MQNCKYLFYVNDTRVFPSYKDDLSKEISQEPGQVFKREKLNGKLTLYGQDYLLIHRSSMDTEFRLKVEIQYHDEDPKLYFSGRFFKTDCAFDIDNRAVELTADPIDGYMDIMEALDKEVDIVQLAPKITRLKCMKRPVIQVYVPGSSKVDCFLSGNHWEQDVTERITDVNKLKDLHFVGVVDQRTVTISMSSNSNYQDAAGVYAGSMNNSIFTKVGDDSYRIAHVDEAYYPRHAYLTIQHRENGSWKNLYYLNGNRTTDPSNAVGGKLITSNWIPGEPIPPESNAWNIRGHAVIEKAVKAQVYTRMMCNVLKIGTLNTYPIPSEDILINNLNYTRIIGLDFPGTILISTSVTDTPTPWGLTSDGKYYQEPYSWGDRVYPIARDSWTGASLWFRFDFLDKQIEESARNEFNIPSAYYLTDVLEVILKELTPNIKFSASPLSSEFFFTSNFVNSQRLRIMLTQKSNLLHGEGAAPATSGVTTLRSIFNMLKNTLQVNWYVKNGYLKLEHIEFFRNGGSYRGSDEVQIDATKLLNSKNKLPYSFGANKIEFEKEDLAEQFQFEYMDESSEIFKGYPLIMQSKLVSLGRVEDISINGFSADIDYLMSNIDSVSQNGFALFAVQANIPTGTAPKLLPNSYIKSGATGTLAEHLDAKPGWATLEVDNRGALIEFNVLLNASPTWGNNVRVVNVTNGNILGASEMTLGANNTLDLPPAIIPWTKRYIVYKTDVTIPPAQTPDGRIGYLEYVNYFPLIAPSAAVVPFVDIQMTKNQITTKYTAQNGYLAWPYLAETLYTYNLPSKLAKLGDRVIRARGTMKNRKQVIDIPLKNDPNELGLIRTGYGYGLLDKANINLTSRLARLTLKYDLYDN